MTTKKEGLLITVNSLALLQIEGLVGQRLSISSVQVLQQIAGSEFDHLITRCCDVDL